MTDSKITTTPGHAFCPTGDAHLDRSLFNVTPDIPIADAMENVSILLGTLHSSLLATAMGERIISGDDAFLMAHTLQSAKAVVDSVTEALQP
jgi:hypothetical protein